MYYSICLYNKLYNDMCPSVLAIKSCISEIWNRLSEQEYKTSLRNENITLKKENTGLIEQVNNYKLIVTDMKAKIQDLENNNSLITADIKNPTIRYKT